MCTSTCCSTARDRLGAHSGGAVGHLAVGVSAAREVDPQRIRVIDSRTNSVGAGLLIEAVGEAIQRGDSLDDLERFALRARKDITVFGAVQELEFAVRGGRVSARAARLIDGLHLNRSSSSTSVGHAGKGGATAGFRRALDSLARRADASPTVRRYG